jgi:hypothetical protein
MLCTLQRRQGQGSEYRRAGTGGEDPGGDDPLLRAHRPVARTAAHRGQLSQLFGCSRRAADLRPPRARSRVFGCTDRRPARACRSAGAVVRSGRRDRARASRRGEAQACRSCGPAARTRFADRAVPAWNHGRVPHPRGACRPGRTEPVIARATRHAAVSGTASGGGARHTMSSSMPSRILAITASSPRRGERAHAFARRRRAMMAQSSVCLDRREHDACCEAGHQSLAHAHRLQRQEYARRMSGGGASGRSFAAAWDARHSAGTRRWLQRRGRPPITRQSVMTATAERRARLELRASSRSRAPARSRIVLACGQLSGHALLDG